jgi:GTP-binding protein
MRISQAKFVGSFPDYKKAPRTGLPEIAFGGRSNVGKSSLLNTLVKRKSLAQISKDPGKTRLLNYYALVNMAGKEAAYFVDLPGYGYARVSKEIRHGWKKLIEEYIEESRELKGFVMLIDSRRGLQEEETQLIEYLLLKNRRVCPVLTKADKLTRQEGTEIVRETSKILMPLGERLHLPVLHSSVKKTGNDLIWRWIDERISDGE